MSTGFYREVVESSAVAVVVVGADAVVRHHTEEVGRMMIGPNADLVGKLFPSLFTADTQTQVDACIRKATAADANVRTTVEATCALRKNDERSIEITAVNLLDVRRRRRDRTHDRRIALSYTARSISRNGKHALIPSPGYRIAARWRSMVGNSSAAVTRGRRSWPCWTSTISRVSTTSTVTRSAIRRSGRSRTV